MTKSNFWRLLAVTVAACFSAPALAAETKTLEVKVQGIEHQKPIPVAHAYCAPKDGKSTDGQNQRPSISWSKGPAGTKSYAVIMVDPDVPTDFSDAGKEGKTIPEDMKRQDFYHWAQIDIPAGVTMLTSGKGSGTSKEQAGDGQPGINSFAKFKEGIKPEEALGYDGPCPPWNDARLHHYHFQVYALDVPTLKLPKLFDAAEAAKAVENHTLAKGEVVGTYTLNPVLRKE